MDALIVDDHEIVRDGIAMLLKDAFSIHSVLFAADGREALKKAINYPIDLVMTDLSMPNGLDGLQALQELRKIIPKAKIIIFSMYDEIDYQKKAFEYGADGYLVKNQKIESIIDSIQKVLQGKRITKGEQVECNTQDCIWNHPFSPRELETFILTVKGNTQTDIANTMNISIRTVETHRRSISKKLGTKNKREWLEYAQKYKMLDMY